MNFLIISSNFSERYSGNKLEIGRRINFLPAATFFSIRWEDFSSAFKESDIGIW